MTARLYINRNWEYCPETWRNFASDIHTRGGFLPEDLFWTEVHQRLGVDYDARFVSIPNGITFTNIPEDTDGYIEFATGQDLTLFTLRWS